MSNPRDPNDPRYPINPNNPNDPRRAERDSNDYVISPSHDQVNPHDVRFDKKHEDINPRDPRNARDQATREREGNQNWYGTSGFSGRSGWSGYSGSGFSGYRQNPNDPHYNPSGPHTGPYNGPFTESNPHAPLGTPHDANFPKQTPPIVRENAAEGPTEKYQRPLKPAQ